MGRGHPEPFSGFSSLFFFAVLSAHGWRDPDSLASVTRAPAVFVRDLFPPVCECGAAGGNPTQPAHTARGTKRAGRPAQQSTAPPPPPRAAIEAAPVRRCQLAPCQVVPAVQSVLLNLAARRWRPWRRGCYSRIGVPSPPPSARGGVALRGGGVATFPSRSFAPRCGACLPPLSLPFRATALLPCSACRFFFSLRVYFFPPAILLCFARPVLSLSLWPCLLMMRARP